MDDYIETKLIVLGEEEIKQLLKEKYPEATHIELYIEYSDEGVEGYDPIIAEVNVPLEEAEKDVDVSYLEIALQQAKVSSELEGANIKEEHKALVRSRLNNDITEEEFQAKVTYLIKKNLY